MPFGSDKPHSWLREDDDFDHYNKPGGSDWFSLSDDVRFDKPNNRHDAFKVESLLGYGGYMDMEKSGGPMGLATGRLEKPIKEFQAKNGLKVDGLLKPGGPTITKMKELYGGVFGGTPAPTPAMVDANAEVTHAGEDGFLYDKGPSFGVRPNKRLDGKAHLIEYERWNREWARGSGNDPTSLAPEYESYIRDLDDEHGHDPGLIFARDLVQQVGKFHGDANGAELAKALAVRLSDRPDLQRELLGGEVPKAPPIGMFKPGGEERIKAWIDQDRVANGIAPKYSKAVAAAQSGAPVLRTSTQATPTPPSEPDPKNLLEYGPNFGLPEPPQLAPSAGEVDPNQMTPLPRPPAKPPGTEAPTSPPDRPGSRPDPRTRTSQQLEIDIQNAQSALDARNEHLQQRIQALQAATAAREAKEAEMRTQFGEDALKGAAEGAAKSIPEATRKAGAGGRGRVRALRILLGGALEGATTEAAPPQARLMRELEGLRQNEREALRLQEEALADRRRELEYRDEIGREREARRNIRPDQ